MLNRCGILVALGLLAGCGAEPETAAWRYDNAAGDASLILSNEAYGGAAGFVLWHVGVEHGGAVRGEIRTLEHLSDRRVQWVTDRKIVFCYVGSMDHGESQWSGDVGGQAFELVFEKRTFPETCA